MSVYESLPDEDLRRLKEYTEMRHDIFGQDFVNYRDLCVTSMAPLLARLEAAELAVADLQVIRDQMEGATAMTPIMQCFDGRELKNADAHIEAWLQSAGRSGGL